MTTHTVAVAFNTRTRRFAAGASITAADLADDALGLDKRVERGDVASAREQPEAKKRGKST